MLLRNPTAKYNCSHYARGEGFEAGAIVVTYNALFPFVPKVDRLREEDLPGDIFKIVPDWINNREEIGIQNGFGVGDKTLVFLSCWPELDADALVVICIVSPHQGIITDGRET